MRTITSPVTFQAVQPAVEIPSSIFSVREFLFLLVHIPLALCIDRIPQVSTLYAWTTMGAATMIALKSVRPEPLVYICAYIAGSEILWRMTGAQVLYQFSKYLIAGIFMIGLIRFRSSKSSLQPLIYFCLLLPSIAVTFWNTETLIAAKGLISYNLSGPFAFTFCAWFLSRLWISEKDIQRIFFCLLAPIVGICTLTIYATLTAYTIRFITEANWTTSAGYSPGHVSAVLGLAGLLCYLLFLFNPASSLTLKTLLIGGWIIFTVESGLTFARAGIYMEAGGAIVASFYLFRLRGLRPSLLMLFFLLVLLSTSIIVPRLDMFTHGKFSERFEDTDPTHRDVLVLDDLRIFKENPLFGVGPGRSMSFRSIYSYKAHTEYTRLLTEHGIFGLLSLGLFLFMLYQRWKNMGTSKLLLAPVLTWGMLFLAVEATRIAAPVFLLGLAFVTVLSNESHLRGKSRAETASKAVDSEMIF